MTRNLNTTSLFLLSVFILLVTSCSSSPTPTEPSPTAAPTQTQLPTPAPTETSTPIASNGTIQFSGYEWDVRDGGLSGPGPNRWEAQNVWLDENGDLHLKVALTAEGWSCAEVTMTQSLGFGRYQFQVIGRVDQLDPNVVLGLFNYPTPDVGQDATHEIDIEFARWGNPAWEIGNFTVWPAQEGLQRVSESFPVELNGTYTTHRFTWQSDRIFFQSLHDHTDNDEYKIAEWLYQPQEPEKYISQQAMPVHINLWLFQGQAPTDGKEVEIVIHRFTFTPLGQ